MGLWVRWAQKNYALATKDIWLGSKKCSAWVGLTGLKGMNRLWQICWLEGVIGCNGFAGLKECASNNGFARCTSKTAPDNKLDGLKIEVGIISSLPESWAYHYNGAGNTWYCPLWIIPVYFFGWPANGNLAWSFPNALGNNKVESDDEIGWASKCTGSNYIPWLYHVQITVIEWTWHMAGDWFAMHVEGKAGWCATHALANMVTILMTSKWLEK